MVDINSRKCICLVIETIKTKASGSFYCQQVRIKKIIRSYVMFCPRFLSSPRSIYLSPLFFAVSNFECLYLAPNPFSVVSITGNAFL